GDVPTGHVRSNFYIGQAEHVRSVGAVYEGFHTPSSAREDTLRAATRAMHDRQTVVLSLPLDVQDSPAPLSNSPLKLPPAASRMHPDPAAVRRLADVILESKRPLVLGGRG